MRGKSFGDFSGYVNPKTFNLPRKPRQEQNAEQIKQASFHIRNKVADQVDRSFGIHHEENFTYTDSRYNPNSELARRMVHRIVQSRLFG